MEPDMYHCEIKASGIAGKGTFATTDIRAGQELFRERAYLVPSAGATTLQPRQQQHGEDHDALRLSTIIVQHKHCPPSIRLAPSDTGGTLSGSHETLHFARAYAAAPPIARAQVLRLAPFGGDDTHAIFELVRAEVALIRGCDHKLREIPSDELERAVHRYWANCMGQEGSLYERASRLNHSCAPNCTRVTLNRGDAERAFVTLRPVVEGEELTLSYLPSGMEVMGTVVRRRHLWLSRGFLCRCDRCSQPQDKLRQVACPECYLADPRRCQQHDSREKGMSGSGLPATPCAHDTLMNEGQARRPLGEHAVFADWWNESGMWVCRSCGWCSDIDSDKTSSLCLHHKEGFLSAEIFSLVMANTVARSTPAAGVVEHGSGKAARNGGDTASENRERPRQDDRQRQARRDAVQGMLETSVALLGRRHWATFSCVLLRLSLFLEEGWGSRPTSPPSTPCPPSPPPPPPPPRAKPEFLEWAVRELTSLWQWLVASQDGLRSHPPAYYLFDVVCDLLDASGKCDTTHRRGLQVFVDEVEVWASTFADEEQRRRFTAAAAVVNLSK